MMCGKPTYEELEQRIKKLEGEIDKRKQAKEALHNSEARLKALSEASFEAIFLSEKGVCLDQNQSAERMFGYTHAEAVGRNGTEWIIPEDRELVKNNMLSGHEKPYEVTALRKDGTTFSCEIQSRMIDCQGRSVRTTALRDITERKKAKVTSKLYERIVDSSSNYMSFLDRKYIYKAVNNAYLVAYKKSREEIVGHSIPELMGKEVFDGLIKEKIDRCLAGELIRYESWFDFPGSGKRFMDVVYHPYLENNGSVSGIIVVSHDITRRKTAEDALKTAKEFAENLVETANTLVITLNSEACITTFNRCAEELTGYKKAEVIGQNWFDIFIPQRDKQTIPRVFEEVLREMADASQHENPIVTKNGKERLISWSNNILRDSSGNINGILGIGIDITEHKRAENVLRENEERFRMLFDQAGDAVFVHNIEGRIVEVNEKACSSLGYSRDELMTMSVFDVEVRLEPEALHELWKGIESNETITAIGKQLRKNGSTSPVEIRLGLIRRQGQKLMIAIVRDISERKKAEKKLVASLKEKEVLLREIHHRVKNNMQVIVSLLRMHSRNIDDARLGRIFDDCRNRVNAMSLIHEALYLSEDLARIDFKIYLKKLCRNLGQAYNASRKKIAVTVEHCNVALDMDQGIAVGMVISELVSNSFKHAFPLGKGGRVSVSLSCFEGKEIELIVQDNGKGLPPEISILNTRSLGLRLAAAAVSRELGGSLKVERNGGTRFIIHFKCKSK